MASESFKPIPGIRKLYKIMPINVPITVEIGSKIILKLSDLSISGNLGSLPNDRPMNNINAYKIYIVSCSKDKSEGKIPSFPARIPSRKNPTIIRLLFMFTKDKAEK